MILDYRLYRDGLSGQAAESLSAIAKRTGPLSVAYGTREMILFLRLSMSKRTDPVGWCLSHDTVGSTFFTDVAHQKWRVVAWDAETDDGESVTRLSNDTALCVLLALFHHTSREHGPVQELIQQFQQGGELQI